MNRLGAALGFALFVGAIWLSSTDEKAPGTTPPKPPVTPPGPPPIKPPALRTIRIVGDEYGRAVGLAIQGLYPKRTVQIETAPDFVTAAKVIKVPADDGMLTVLSIGIGDLLEKPSDGPQSTAVNGVWALSAPYLCPMVMDAENHLTIKNPLGALGGAFVYLVPPTDVPAVAERVQAFIDDGWTRIKAEGRAAMLVQTTMTDLQGTAAKVMAAFDALYVEAKRQGQTS